LAGRSDRLVPLVNITRKAAKKQTRLMTSLMANLTDTLQSVKPLKAMAREHLADKVLAHDTNLLNKSQRRQVLGGALLNSAQEMMFTVFICLGIYIAIDKFAMALPTSWYWWWHWAGLFPILAKYKSSTRNWWRVKARIGH
jgi:hypothetical protein